MIHEPLRALYVFFFFSSRRRHTRFDCDWSSDVCSSDLEARSGPCTMPGPTATSHFGCRERMCRPSPRAKPSRSHCPTRWSVALRSEEHTSELQSQSNLVCRLLLEKKKILLVSVSSQ